VKVELRGVRLRGYHGAYEQEQRDGQDFLYDVELEVGDRGADDELEHAVDYTEVAAVVREVNERRFDLLEALASTLADTLMERFLPASVRVRVRKPEARPAGLEVEYSAVTVERP
jgi:dihydroneopterin aldolase